MKPQGEVLTSKLNDTMRSYNDIIRRVTGNIPKGVLIDVYTDYCEEIAKHIDSLTYRAPCNNITDIVQPGRIVRAMLLRSVTFGFMSWNAIGEREGFVMSIDGKVIILSVSVSYPRTGLHCNDRAAQVFANVTAKYLTTILAI